MSLPNPLRVTPTMRRMQESRFAKDLRVLGVVSSTQRILADLLAKDAPDGTVVCADEQKEGRGRRGTRWVSPNAQGLLVSALVRPTPDITLRPWLTTATGLAICDAVETCGVAATLKWPNDVLVGREKIAGCLIEVNDDGVLIGIGLNVNGRADELPREAAIPATSLRLATGESHAREPLLAALLDALAGRLAQIESGRLDALEAAFRERDALRGAHATVRSGDTLIEGTILHAHPVEGLCIRLDDGTTESVPAAHAHVLRVTFPS